LDIALGVGGLPRGRVIEIYGPESSGKTTLTLQVIAEMQKQAGTCAFIDAEHALDVQYAQKLGVNLQELLISQPDTGEQALEIVDALVRSGSVDLIVIDSVAALTPKAELEGEMGDSLPGLQARLMSQALRKLTGTIKKTNCMVIFINQIRMKIGVMFGNPETTTGGNALKFYASVRLDIRRTGSIKKGEEVIGSETKVKVVKNKVSPPFKTAEFDILYGEGISREGEVIDMGVNARILEKSGAWYAYNGEKIGQGKDNAREFLRENVDLAREIENKVRDEPPAWRAGLSGRTLIRPDAGSGPVGLKRPALSLRARALGYLSQREHSRSELRRKLLNVLRRAQVEGDDDPVPAVDALLDALSGEGWLSDSRYIESRLRTRAPRLGARRLAAELAQQGLKPEGEAWEQVRASEAERAGALLLRRFGAVPPADAQERLRRVRFLVTRGFAQDLALRLTRTGFSAEPEE
jgi:recombination protein RecA